MRALVFPLVLLQLAGGIGIVLGSRWMQWRTDRWSQGHRGIAETLCPPGERFTVWPVRKGVGYFCADALGNRRSLTHALDVVSPGRSPSMWAPLVGSCVALVTGMLLTGLVLRPAGRKSRGRKAVS